MISINVIVPIKDGDQVTRLEDSDLQIIESASSREKDITFFNINTTEENFTFLTLKFGKINVWKR